MPDPSSPSIVRNLQPLQTSDKAEVSIKDIVERVEEHQGLAPVVCVLTLPVLLPLPPGFSIVLALPLLVAAPQMMVGKKDLWLPEWLAGRTMTRKTVQGSLRRFLPWLERVEGLVRPRLRFLTGQAGATVVGALCTLMAVVLVLPLPFANLLPSLTVLLLSLGITRRDGLTVLIGVALLAAAVTGVVWGLHGARLGLHRLFNL